ncbi:MAG: DUF2802 domain-containing protein [Gammaproteobacteria bacterium]|nr:DUF2802 domain-containing protein [Gammaproteobacteria bacterium]
MEAEWLILINAILACTMVATSLMVFLSRQQLHETNKRSNIQIEQLRIEIRGLYDAAHGLGEKLHRYEKRVRSMEEWRINLDAEDTRSGTYFRASSMAQRGADAKQLVKNLGINPAEANLIAALNRTVQTPSYGRLN